MDFEILSKEVSYALRHNPKKYGLELDTQGWVDVGMLVLALSQQDKFKSLSICDVEEMIRTSEKKRHEICDGKIRALYGHSTHEKIAKEPTRPPDILYHGTAPRFVGRIFEIGLIPKNRQYVHLSEDVDTAEAVGKRRDITPVILIIDAKGAWENGVLFYSENDNIWLSDDIPAKYISLR
jgi:putative RNA 2'-phosphotransferase